MPARIAFSRQVAHNVKDVLSYILRGGLMENILFALKAILPILLVMTAGALARRFTPFDKSFFKQLNALAFRFFLSVNLFCNVYSVEDIRALNGRVIVFVIISFFICAFIGIAGSRLVTKDPLKRGPIAQAAFRSNNAIIGIPLAQALGGTAMTETVAFASLCSGLSIPFYSVAAVILLTDCANRANVEHVPSLTVGQWMKKIMLNPLVIGSVAGLVCLFVRTLLPTVDGKPVFTIASDLPSVYGALSILSKAASPVMLFALGANLDFSAAKELWREITVGVLLRIVICPAVIIGLAVLLRNRLGLTCVETPTLISVFASPVSISSAVVVQEHGCDEDLGGHLVVWSSILSMGTMFLFILLLRSIGLI